MADDYAELIVVLALVKHAGEDEDIPTLEENAKNLNAVIFLMFHRHRSELSSSLKTRVFVPYFGNSKKFEVRPKVRKSQAILGLQLANIGSFIS